MTNFLNALLAEAATLRQNGRPCLAIFDLDSTLFDVSPRIQAILRDFSNLTDIKREFPEAHESLSKIEVQPKDWGIKSALIRAGVHHFPETLREKVRDFWMQHFFSHHYLDYDQPYPGAVEFVNKLANLGVPIHYLTGRDEERMGQGTRQTLESKGFPVGNAGETYMKPKAGMDDAQFKVDHFKKIAPQDRIWFFENEPVNIHRVRKHHPEVRIVFFDSTHSGKESPPVDLPRLLDYLLV